MKLGEGSAIPLIEIQNPDGGLILGISGTPHHIERAIEMHYFHNSRATATESVTRLVEIVHLESGAATGLDASIRGRATVRVLARDGPEPTEQARRPKLGCRSGSSEVPRRAAARPRLKERSGGAAFPTERGSAVSWGSLGAAPEG